MLKNNIQHFKKNPTGQDYVVGDIHGCFPHLEQLLKKIGFNPKTDRLFSVGDLCDRGPNSPDVETWLNYSWFHPVMGNHEEIILLYEKGQINSNTLVNLKADWWLGLSQKSKNFILEKYQALPIAIEIETSKGLIGIVHAECPHANWLQLSSLLNSPMHSTKATGKCLWGTQTPVQKYIIDNVKAVFVGHMTQENYKVNGNVYLIDTGAGYQGGKLTVFNLHTFTYSTQKC